MRRRRRGKESGFASSSSPFRSYLSFAGDAPNDQNTMVFKLHVKCERNRDAVKGETDPSKLYIGENGSFSRCELTLR